MSVIEKYDHDLIILGGGSSGLAMAFEARKLKPDLKIAIFDYAQPDHKGSRWKRPGGVCVNVGCIPKKLMHTAGLFKHTMKCATSLGWTNADANADVGANFECDWSNLVESIQNYIHSLNYGYEKQMKQAKITYINAYASFVDEHTVEYIVPRVSNKNKNNSENKSETPSIAEAANVAKVASTKVTSRHIVIAVGGRPNIPKYPGFELGITSDDIFSLPKHPGKTLTVGGGYISLECASFLHELGCEVDVMVRSELLRGFDRQCVNQIGELMELNGMKFLQYCDIKEMKSVDGKIQVTYNCHKAGASVGADANEVAAYDTVLFAIGRTPITAGLNLKNANINFDAKTMKILVDDFDCTSTQNIFALGDCVNKPELTPMAIKSGLFLARRLYSTAGTASAISATLKDPVHGYVYIPTTVFTDPEYGCCGYSQEAAEDKFGKENIDCTVSRFGVLETATHFTEKLPPRKSNCFDYFLPSDDATVATDAIHTAYAEDKGEDSRKRLEQPCLAKLIYLKSGAVDSADVLVGFHYVGPNAGEITQGFSLALKKGVNRGDFDCLVGIHPTAAEEFTSLKISLNSKQSFMKDGGC